MPSNLLSLPDELLDRIFEELHAETDLRSGRETVSELFAVWPTLDSWLLAVGRQQLHAIHMVPRTNYSGHD